MFSGIRHDFARGGGDFGEELRTNGAFFAKIGATMRYQFLIDTYETEIEKVLSVWAMCRDDDLRRRPRDDDRRGRSLHEHMVHQCVSENLWFEDMLGVSVTENPLPPEETRMGFIKQYAHDARARLEALKDKDVGWWEETVNFFEERRTRGWIMTRRIAHTAHHRGQQTILLRILGQGLHSTYGPTADTGGLMQHNAPVIYPYPDLDALLAGETGGGNKRQLPGPGDRPVTERPDR